MKSADDVLSDLAEILGNFQGREYSGVIHRETMFFADLGFMSIDAVILGEALENRYGRSLPFQDFLSELSARDARDLSVGELADWLAPHVD